MLGTRLIKSSLQLYHHPTAAALQSKLAGLFPQGRSIGGNNRIKSSISRNVHTGVKPLTHGDTLIFRQMFHGESYTYTYLLGCPDTRDAVIIDPVYEMVNRDLKCVKELDLNLIYGLNTHVHADHVTGTGKLKTELPNFKSVISKQSGAKADVYIDHEEELKFGKQLIKCLSTPGHTGGCTTYLLAKHGIAFTGDTLLVRACGRTDFQEGDPVKLYDSVHQQIFSLPDNFLLYPGHDYMGFSVTTVGEEKLYNPRLTLSKQKFIEFMRKLDLAYPKLIDKSVPANLKCGEISKQAVIGSDAILKKGL